MSDIYGEHTASGSKSIPYSSKGRRVFVTYVNEAPKNWGLDSVLTMIITPVKSGGCYAGFATVLSSDDTEIRFFFNELLYTLSNQKPDGSFLLKLSEESEERNED